MRQFQRAYVADGTEELRRELKALGHSFETSSDTEVILTSYMEYGPEFVKKLNGIFAIAIMDPVQRRLLLYRVPGGCRRRCTGENGRAALHGCL